MLTVRIGAGGLASLDKQHLGVHVLANRTDDAGQILGLCGLMHQSVHLFLQRLAVKAKADARRGEVNERATAIAIVLGIGNGKAVHVNLGGETVSLAAERKVQLKRLEGDLVGIGIHGWLGWEITW